MRLGSRAFDLLAALVERAGEVVGKDELTARAWPNLFVEESNLKIQVCAPPWAMARRAIGTSRPSPRAATNLSRRSPSWKSRSFRRYRRSRYRSATISGNSEADGRPRGWAYQGVLAILHADIDTGLRLFRASADELRGPESTAVRLITFLTVEAFGRTGQMARGSTR